MGLIKCPDCGKEFSDRANACPNCGCPTDIVLLEKDSKEDITIFEDKSKIEERYIGGYSCDVNTADEIDKLIYDGKKVNAIKKLRDYAGIQELNVAKEAVENYMKELGVDNEELNNSNTNKKQNEINVQKSKKDIMSVILAILCFFGIIMPFIGIIISFISIARENINAKKNGRKISNIMYIYISTALLSFIVTLVFVSSLPSKDEQRESSNENIYEDYNEVVTEDVSNENNIEANNDIPSYTAKEMLDEFENNNLRAKEEFDGKYISVTGIVERISEDGKKIYIANSEYAFYNIVVSVDFEKYKDTIYMMSTGDKITVIGTCSYIYDPIYVNVYSIESDEIILE